MDSEVTRVPLNPVEEGGLIVASRGTTIPPDEMVTMNLAISFATKAQIDHLARLLGGTQADVFTKGLALLSIAAGAKNKGNHLAIVRPDGGIEAEITGL